MAATGEQIVRLRAMGPDQSAKTSFLAPVLERFPLIDELGAKPYTLNLATDPPTEDANEAWIATYDLHAAAAELWEAHAGTLVGEYDFKDAAGQSFNRSQAHAMAMTMARYHKARRAPKSFRLQPWPKQPRYDTDTPWIGNLPEPDEE